MYNLRRPYDLVAFMQQEERASMLNGLKKELLSRKDEIDRNEDRDTGTYIMFHIFSNINIIYCGLTFIDLMADI